MNKLNEAALKHYLVQTTDMRRCPKSDCDYSGTVVIDQNTNKINCYE